jgi:hypothetical protein
MVRFEVDVDIGRPPDIVDQALMRPENFPYWNEGLVRFEVVRGEPGKAGAVGRLHYVQKGQEHVMEDVLEHAEPGRSYVSRVSGPAITARIETRMEPIHGGTRLTILWTGRGRTTLTRVLLPLMKRRLVVQSRRELALFKDLVESRGPDFSR